MKLYGYWRSSASWRVRTALAFKGLEYEYVAVHLVQGGGEQRSEEYRRLNPMAQVPSLVVDEDGEESTIGQSMAILEYLEERFPEPGLLPEDSMGRARARQLAEIVNSGIQPLQNLRIIQKLRDELGQDAKSWCAGFIGDGLRAYEALAGQWAGEFSVGDEPSYADICLIPQLYNARRFDVDLEAFPTLLRIEEACEKLDAFEASHPDRQPDAP
ncbi:MAG: maleylacetoacetate isomerase [Bradymonadaceae bacterium]